MSDGDASRGSHAGRARSAGAAPRAVLLSGAGRYGDPWHPFAETSAALAEMLGEAGFAVDRFDAAEAALAALDGASLLVVNAGDPDGPNAEGAVAAPADPELVAAGDQLLRAALERGIGVLATHTGAASLREYSAYGEALGGRWVRGRSWHPPLDEAHVRVVGAHPARSGVDDFVVRDERYLDLDVTAPVEIVAEHEHDGARHPLVWARTTGRSRVVVDLLGHLPESYASPGHRALLRGALAWLAGAGA
ncbi:ThuA domain-containing protein [Agromyces soli]